MAKDLKLDPETRDIEWPPRYISGKAEIQQALTTLLLTPKGSFLNFPDVGMDYTFMFKKYNPFELKLAVINAVKQDQRVTHVNSVHIKRNHKHHVNVDVDVQTTLGRIHFDKEMKPNALRR